MRHTSTYNRTESRTESRKNSGEKRKPRAAAGKSKTPIFAS